MGLLDETRKAHSEQEIKKIGEKVSKKDYKGLYHYMNWGSSELTRLTALALRDLILAYPEEAKKNGVEKILVAKLYTTNVKVREAVVAALDALQWQPSEPNKEAYFRATHRWEEIAKIGKPALPFLLRCI